MNSKRTLKWSAISVIAFGVLTAFGSGRRLFSNEEALTVSSNMESLVHWLNFAAGLVYVQTGTPILCTMIKTSAKSCRP